MKRFHGGAASVLDFVSGEWLLTKYHLPNGGTVIAMRAMIAALLIYGIGLALMNFIDPTRAWQFSFTEMRLQVLATAKWFGAIFVGVYTALYSRFASQWSYVAGIYNQIKAAECRGGEPKLPLNQWKAGFIEDADALHVAAKPAIASVIRNWGSDEEVKAQFEIDVPNGAARLPLIMKRVEAVCARISHDATA
jgi:hypothetical protein